MKTPRLPNGVYVVIHHRFLFWTWIETGWVIDYDDDYSEVRYLIDLGDGKCEWVREDKIKQVYKF